MAPGLSGARESSFGALVACFCPTLAECQWGWGVESALIAVRRLPAERARALRPRSVGVQGANLVRPLCRELKPRAVAADSLRVHHLAELRERGPHLH